MTDLLSRVLPADPEAASRPTAAAAAAAVLAWAGGLVLCVGVAAVGWLAGTGGSFTGSLRVGAGGWLLGHGAGLRTASVTITVLPVGLLAILGAVVWSAGRWVARSTGLDDLRSVLVATATLAAGYAALATVTAVLAANDQVSAAPVRAFAGSLLVAAVFGGAGMARAAGVVTSSVDRWPDEARAAARGACAVVAVLVGAGALLTTASLLSDFGRAATMTAALEAGVAGTAVFTVLQVLLLPNAALLGVSYLVGPGFALGADTLVAPSGTTLGQLPLVPLLAAVPEAGPAPWWATALLGVPVLAGGLGALVALRGFGVDTVPAGVRRGSLAALLGGVVAGLATALGGGAAGPGRMADVGAAVWQCAGLGGLAAGVGGAAVGAVHVWWSRRRG